MIINGTSDGPCVFLTAAVHDDELNGVKIIQEVAARYEPYDLHGALVWPGRHEQTTTEFDVIGESPVDQPALRIEHATASLEIKSEPNGQLSIIW
ncbi:hypothetical protein C2R22_22915 (plasmid) [Salinigranum rubrum]|uniref:Succinylglutamate desuccinylase n=1 Tax=Salinigranum rubrum TaxID=755307 RepID=A0A2I8VR73_9EURY|nr:hypothetical protein C2R22_22915 [Salinigranum rubrum]